MCQRSLKKLVRECVSKYKLCQAENERFKSVCLSMKREFVKPETIKTNFKNLSNGSKLSNPETLSNYEKLSRNQNRQLKILSKSETVSMSD